MDSRRPNVTPASSPIEAYPDLIDPSHAPLLKSMIGVMLIGSLTLIGFVLASPGEERWRLAPAIAVGVLALLTAGTYRSHGTGAAIRLMIAGGWLLSTVTAFFGEGVRSPILMIHAVILIFAGWVLGTRYCAKLFAASMVAVVAMTASQRLGWLTPARPAADGVVVVAHLVILSLSVVMTLYLVELFGARYAKERALTQEIRGHLDAVERRERYQRALLDNFPFMVWLKDEQGRFLAVNQALAAAVDKEAPEEIAGKTIFDIVPRDLAIPHDAEDRRVTAGGSPRMVESSAVMAGREIWYESYRAPVTLDEKVIGTVGFARDITERRQVAAELERHRHHLANLVDERTAALSIAKEAAETASRAKSTFLANMSHELRTPLNAMIGMTALARNRSTDPTQSDYLSKADQASRQLLRIIDDILDISRIEADKLDLEHGDFQLGRVLDDLAAVVEIPIQKKALAFEIDVATDVVRMGLRGDPTRLGQVLLNLVNNAVKFTPAGSVRLTVERLEHGTEHVILQFRISDTGIGIAPADQGRIFHSFEQADTSMTRRHGGTGLGLAISKRLVEAMGGCIGVESEPGKGSTFWFTTRLQKAPAVPASEPGSEAERLAACSGKRVLLVEDEPMNQIVAIDLLKSFGCHTDLADDGLQGLERIRQGTYDLVLMDIQLPNLNGLDATRAVRRMPGKQKLFIIAATANAYEEDRRRCFEAGVDDYIAKPFTAAQLLEIVARWLARVG